MKLQIREIGTQLKNFWQGANQGLKLRLLIGVVLGISLVVGVVLFTRPRYETLFANLTPADAGQISQRLQDMKINYRLGDDGKSILVPSTEVYELRNQLAMEGLPKGSTVGFEIFDRTKLGVTDFERRIEYMRALRGELSRTISQLEGVRSAQVELALPEERLFAKDSRPPTASVVLETVGQLDAGQVRAIVHLVSHSVEGLTPDNITVVDTSGQVLSDLIDPDISLTGLSTSQLQLQRSVEKEVERNVQTMLEQVLGPQMVVTRVKAELNFDQREVTSEFFQPVVDEEGILRSIQELKKTFDGAASAAEPAGTSTNVPPTYQTPDGNQGHYEEVETTKNYEVSQTREHLVVAPGSVRHLSVSVLVNANREGGFTQQELDAIKTAVIHAVGLRPEDRQDQISVVSLPFSGLTPEPAAVLPRRMPRQLIYVLLAAVVALITVLVLRSRRQRILAGTELLREEVAVREAAAAEEDPEALERERIRKDVERLARQRPEELAQLLATWMNE
ncbi:MAG: flagellar M-ring protein FliF [Firmicutes bacterium]|jgi:flagellar M-ring protein FliF|nr:flagellar M-ring protein FliF [Bacillota bacterium]